MGFGQWERPRFQDSQRAQKVCRHVICRSKCKFGNKPSSKKTMPHTEEETNLNAGAHRTDFLGRNMPEEEALTQAMAISPEYSMNSSQNLSQYRPHNIRPGPRASIFRPHEEEEETQYSMSSMVSQMTEAEQLQKAIGHSLKITSSPSHCRPDHIRPGRRATIFRPRTHTEGDDKNAGLSEEEALRKAIENSLEAATEQEEEAKVLKCPLAGCP